MIGILLAVVEAYCALSTVSTDAASYYTTHYQNVSAFDFSMHECEQQTSYVDNPVIEKYFSKYEESDFMSYQTMKDIFDNPVMLDDLESTVNRIHTNLENILVGMPERVSEMMKENTVSRIKSLFRSFKGIFSNNIESRLDKFLQENVNSYPHEFFRKYTDFMIRYITKEIQGYGEMHGIPDELFERLTLLSEFKTMFFTCSEWIWDFNIPDILHVINNGILNSYKYLSKMLSDVQSRQSPRICSYKAEVARSRDTLWATTSHDRCCYRDRILRARTDNYDRFYIDTLTSISNIEDDIRNMKEVPSENLMGNIQSDTVYDHTDKMIKKHSTEKIDMEILKGVIKEINNITFNPNNYQQSHNEESIYKDMDEMYGVTPLGGRTYTFKWTVGSKSYLLRSKFNHIERTFDSPYIAELYKVLYNRVTLKDGSSHKIFWTVSEFLEFPAYSINGSDMNIVRQLASDVLNGLKYIQSQGIVHGDLHADNVWGRKIQEHGKTRYQFKIVDFDYFDYFSEPGSPVGNMNVDEYYQKPYLQDMWKFYYILSEITKSSEDVTFKNFMSEWKEEVKITSEGILPDIDKLLSHSFITGSTSTTERETQ